MQNCTHEKTLRYARRIFQNDTVHFCVQCSNCKKIVKTSRHDGKLFISLADIPTGATIHPYIEE